MYPNPYSSCQPSTSRAPQSSSTHSPPHRVTVALSRARDGLLIVGNFSLLLQSEVWSRYIKAATQWTPIVTRSYIRAIGRRVIRDSRGLITLARPETIVSLAHEELNRQFMQ